MTTKKVRLQMLIKALVGDDIDNLQDKHPGRKYCLRWKRGGKTENKGRTIFVEAGEGAIEWGQRGSVEMTLQERNGAVRPKLMKLGVEREGTSGPFQSNLIGECVIDATAYVFPDGHAKEFAFPINLYNKTTSTVKLHVVFTTRIMEAVSSAQCSTLTTSSIAMSEIGSEASCGDLPSPRTLLKLREETSARLTPFNATIAVTCKKCFGSGLPVRSKLKLKVTFDGGKSLSTPARPVLAEKHIPTVRWVHHEDVETVLFKNEKAAFQKSKVTVSLETVEGTQLSTAEIDVCKYLCTDRVAEYAFPLKSEENKDLCKVQLSFQLFTTVTLATSHGEVTAVTRSSVLDLLPKSVNILPSEIHVPHKNLILTKDMIAKKPTLADLKLEDGEAVAFVYPSAEETRLKKLAETLEKSLATSDAKVQKLESALRSKCTLAEQLMSEVQDLKEEVERLSTVRPVVPTPPLSPSDPTTQWVDANVWEDDSEEDEEDDYRPSEVTYGHATPAWCAPRVGFSRVTQATY
eukprot:TRINITY_DN13629_c0_g2_i1.p1 TRINITY_DN13629_c0_g2~~TRINITY_DN13629_c0_g2_i1.p1  ORF type:complete len:535 (+),score=118.40 TRINITY_DN13629_c0_g2_i1:51-1607(+)